MSLSDPTKKMSKSDALDKGCIYLLDAPEVARKKIMSAVTDTLGKIAFDPVNQPGIANLLQIHSALSGRSIDDLVGEFEGQGYGTFKKAVAEEVVKLLSTLQARYRDIMDQGILDQVLSEGAAKARVMAEAKLQDVQRKIGLTIDATA
jgi:tryptophanyl-tRNA synthetase